MSETLIIVLVIINMPLVYILGYRRGLMTGVSRAVDALNELLEDLHNRLEKDKDTGE